MCSVARETPKYILSPSHMAFFALYLEYTSLSTVTFLEKNVSRCIFTPNWVILSHCNSSNKYHNIISNATSVEHVLCSETVVVALYMLFLILMKANRIDTVIFKVKQAGAQGAFVKSLRSHTW